jgi:hypothetical protein
MEFYEFKEYNERVKEYKIDKLKSEYFEEYKSQDLCNRLNFDNLIDILTFLEIEDILNLRLTSKQFKNICYNDLIWRGLSKNIIKNLSFNETHLFNEEDMNWFEYYSKYINPLLKDYKKIFSKKNESIKIGLFFDLKPNIDIPIGYTKFGGSPDLPENFKWQTNYQFICQINFSDDGIKNSFTSTFKKLPKSGILYFFSKYPDYEDTMCYFYEGDESKLKRTPSKAGFDNEITQSSVIFYDQLISNDNKSILPHKGFYNCFFGEEKFLKSDKRRSDPDQIPVLQIQFDNHKTNFKTPKDINDNDDSYHEEVRYVYLKYSINSNDLKYVMTEEEKKEYGSVWETIVSTKSYEIISKNSDTDKTYQYYYQNGNIFN